MSTPSCIGPRGLDLIKRFEGLRLNAYRDAVGVWTIGYGHTRSARPGQKITRAMADDLLASTDLPVYERAVRKHVEVPLSQHQFDALVSLAFNIGTGAFRDSTLLSELNRRDYVAAARQFERWVFAGGKRLNGLVRRRKAERALFESGKAGWLDTALARTDARWPDSDTDLLEVDLPVVSFAVGRPMPGTAAAYVAAWLLGLGPRSILAAKSALPKFQADNGLVPDGIVGPNTWRALIRAMHIQKNPEPKP